MRPLLFARNSSNLLKPAIIKPQSFSLVLYKKPEVTLLHQYVINNNLEQAKALISKQPSLINKQSNNGETAAHIAARLGHLDILKFLADDLNANLMLTNTAHESVYETAKRYNADAAEYLKSIGATVVCLYNKGRYCQRGTLFCCKNG